MQSVAHASCPPAKQINITHMVCILSSLLEHKRMLRCYVAPGSGRDGEAPLCCSGGRCLEALLGDTTNKGKHLLVDLNPPCSSPLWAGWEGFSVSSHVDKCPELQPHERPQVSPSQRTDAQPRCAAARSLCLRQPCCAGGTHRYVLQLPALSPAAPSEERFFIPA